MGIWIKKRLLAHWFDQSHYDKLNADLSCFLLQKKKKDNPFVSFTGNRTGNAIKVIQLDFDFDFAHKDSAAAFNATGTLIKGI